MGICRVGEHHYQYLEFHHERFMHRKRSANDTLASLKTTC